MTPVDMIAIDMDDTLLRDDVSISSYTADVLRQAQDAGVRIVIATGRMFCAARPWGMKLGLGDVPMVVYTGSMVARCESGDILSYEAMDLDLARDILAEGRAHGWYMQTYIHDRLFVPFRDSRTETYERVCGVAAETLGDAFWTPEEPPLKILLYEEDPAVMEAASRHLLARFGSRAGHVRSRSSFLEFNKKGASKGAALTKLCGEWGIPLSRMMAFGNAENDVSMLSLTPWSFAVENASPEARRAAAHVTLSNNEDGVAKAVEQYVLRGK